MKKAIYPGTFDPITFGHIDLIKKSLNIFDQVIVAVSDGNTKNYLFDAEEREALIKKALPEASVKVTDLAGDGNHYAAEVIDESFRGKNRVQQQRIVYSALKGKMDGSHGELHALALTTKVPEG